MRWSKKRSLMLLLTLCCVFASVASAQEHQKLKGCEYFISADQMTVAWDVVSGATGYEVRLVKFDAEPLTYFAAQQTTQTQFTFNRPRSGHFAIEVRACNEIECSRWGTSVSEQDGNVDGEAMKWWIYWKLKPITGLEFDTGG